MTDNDETTQPRAIERWIEGNLPGYRFGVVLALLLTTFVFMASAPTGAWVRVVTVALQGLTLLAALRASQVSRRLVRVAALVVGIAFVSSLGSLAITTSSESTGAFDVVALLMVGVAPIAIARALWLRPVVDTHTVLGAICIYVLVGMLYAFVYSAIGLLGSEQFFVQTNDASTADYLYFSFVTLTTVGYGDFTAAGGLGRALASLEALLGQVYLVTVVATIVAGMTRTRGARDQTLAPASEESSPPGAER
ncbi:MAG: ion channel [Acidimicrobiia bacterium]